MGRFVRRSPLGDPGVFCGHPPCGLCFMFVGDEPIHGQAEISGKEKMSLDLLGKFLDELSPTELAAVEKAQYEIHTGQIDVRPTVLDLPPADIGMSDAAYSKLWLDQRKPPAAPIKPRHLTIDEMLDREQREAKEKEAQPQPEKVKVPVFAEAEEEAATPSPKELVVTQTVAEILTAAPDPFWLR